MSLEQLELYSFRPTCHGPTSFYVLAASKEEAIKAIIEKVKDMQKHIDLSDRWYEESEEIQEKWLKNDDDPDMHRSDWDDPNFEELVVKVVGRGVVLINDND